jgi:hypothetical protein
MARRGEPAAPETASKRSNGRHSLLERVRQKGAATGLSSWPLKKATQTRMLVSSRCEEDGSSLLAKPATATNGDKLGPIRFVRFGVYVMDSSLGLRSRVTLLVGGQ